MSDRSASGEGAPAGYRERPASRLPGAQIWTRPAGGGPEEDTRVLPDGCMDLIWHEAADGLLVAGPDTRAHTSRSTPDAGWAGLRLPPGVAPALLGVPAHELRDRRVPLAEVLPLTRARRLTARVDRATDRGAALERIALELAGEPPDPLCQAVAAGLRRGRPVAELADEVALSPRQLHRRALAAFGYGPKTLARVLRLRAALPLITSGRPLAEVAAATGYADQAHLTREVRALTGLPPGRLRSHPAGTAA
ncbi:helix-turn-helix transcriptional regulator [Streptomyces sp. OF3]|uniref:Helix-turn-helix transcriptional regulator n=1 Tax=Streptomyces alkaliterrae TaxID=2213162 RepID=A0A7W3WHM0_9ACTN|nr:helix-turn-helix transcriptional regulator [Streptomyces alkaliterrae]MBB1252030.1 helix-turn-helix transcriptional regulator [Streptomyces alkaliterrae]